MKRPNVQDSLNVGRKKTYKPRREERGEGAFTSHAIVSPAREVLKDS